MELNGRLAFRAVSDPLPALQWRWNDGLVPEFFTFAEKEFVIVEHAMADHNDILNCRQLSLTRTTR
jgi:hypothetical protein